jgi:hypothetical protein
MLQAEVNDMMNNLRGLPSTTIPVSSTSCSSRSPRTPPPPPYSPTELSTTNVLSPRCSEDGGPAVDEENGDVASGNGGWRRSPEEEEDEEEEDEGEPLPPTLTRGTSRNGDVLELGCLVEVVDWFMDVIYGVIRWIGYVEGKNNRDLEGELMAGLEMVSHI